MTHYLTDPFNHEGAHPMSDEPTTGELFAQFMQEALHARRGADPLAASDARPDVEPDPTDAARDLEQAIRNDNKENTQ